MSTMIDHLHWRYATKKFDPGKKLSEEQLNDLLESIRLAASSYGLQPYRAIVITDPVLRTTIRSHAWDQAQITDASHLIALCTLRSIDEAYVDRHVDHIAGERNVERETLKGYRDMMVGSVKRQTAEGLEQWNKCQTYIALGFLLSAAAHMHIDACPMEGFDPVHVDVDLGLAEKNLTTTVLCPVGFRADDPAARNAKVRLSKEEFFTFKR